MPGKRVSLSKDWEELSERIAYWLDYHNPYITCANDYISSVWSILARFFEEGLLYKGSRVLPYCPTCGTGLSSHEVAQGYEDVKGPSVFIRFPRKGHDHESFLVWTTTPWTLPSNVALAVHEDLTYARVQRPEADGEVLIVAEPLMASVFRKEKVEVLGTLPGAELVGETFERPFDLFDVGEGQSQVVIAADFVSAEDGTGIVHIAPAFGVDDHQCGVAHDLAMPNPVDAEGKFDARVGEFAGRDAREANDDLCADLKSRGRLFRKEIMHHSYPHCWRCKTPLLYWLRPCWYIRTTELRDQLVQLNQEIDWFPPEIGAGRFGEWLSNNVDWALSRERYWGTPLNLWVCESCDKIQSVASAEDLRTKVPDLPEDFDLHRPFIDDIELPCECGQSARRTPEVIDCWFDSGAMPFAQQGWIAKTDAPLPPQFPADFIAEGLDQTRGWFYTLHVISTFLTGQPAYRRCLVNNLLLDAKKQKMSKSRGNTVDPWQEINRHGVDAIRWYLLGQSNPWLPKVYDSKAVSASSRDFFGTLFSCYSFFATYASIDGFDPALDERPGVSARTEMDRWVLAELSRTIGNVRDCMERYDLTKAVQSIADFVDKKLSNWYVRRSRSRFWTSGKSADKLAATFTLYEVLLETATLLAPFAPFFAEALDAWLRGEDESVHLRSFPIADDTLRDQELEESMDAVLRLVNLGRRARNTAEINNRQPLGMAYVKGPTAAMDEILGGHFGQLAAEELNVKQLRVAGDEIQTLRTLKAKPNFKLLGPKVGKRMGAVKAAVEALDEQVLEDFLRTGDLSLSVDGEELTLSGAEIEVLLEGKEGYGVATDGYYLVALDTTLTPELIEDGQVREIVKRINNSRREAGLNVEDRIQLHLAGSAELVTVAERHQQKIAEETLATKMVINPQGNFGGTQFDWKVGDLELQVAVEKA